MATLQGDTVTTLTPLELGAISEQPLVSILMSNYNYALYIGQAIESALGQSYRNIELIICDDGSTDDSARIIEEYERKDDRLKLIRKVNGGQASGFNAAFYASRGEIITLLDSDDLFLPEKVEMVVANFAANPDAGFGVHRVIRISADNRRQGVWPMSAPLPRGWYGDGLLTDGGVLPYMPPTSGLSLRRQVAERIFPLPLEDPLVKCPDQYITRIAPLLTRVTRADEALAEYRLHGSNNYGPDKMSAASVRKELDYCEALWGGQKRFLAGVDSRLAENFQPLSLSPFIIHSYYLWARLAKDSAVRRYYDAFIPCLQPGSRHKWFWKLSIYMPYPVFVFALNVMVRQSWLKQMIAHFKKMS
jgi:glycosyltransferase involved in cell wall biosynthesis